MHFYLQLAISLISATPGGCDDRRGYKPNRQVKQKVCSLYQQVELVLKDLVTSTKKAVTSSLDTYYPDLDAAIVALRAKDQIDIRDHTNRLEKDVLALFDGEMGAVQVNADKILKDQFFILSKSLSTASTLVQAAMAATIDTISKLPEAEAAAKVKDTELGLQFKLNTQIDNFVTKVDNAASTTMGNVVTNLHRMFHDTERKLINEIAILFKEYSQKVTSIYSKYPANLSAKIQEVQSKFITHLTESICSNFTTENNYITAMAAQIVSQISGCEVSRLVDQRLFYQETAPLTRAY